MFRTNLVSFRTFRRPLLPKPVCWLERFLPFLIARRLYKEIGFNTKNWCKMGSKVSKISK